MLNSFGLVSVPKEISSLIAAALEVQENTAPWTLFDLHAAKNTEALQSCWISILSSEFSILTESMFARRLSFLFVASALSFATSFITAFTGIAATLH